MRDAEHPAPQAPAGAGAPPWAPQGGAPVELTAAHLVAVLHHVDDALKAEGIPLTARHRVTRTILYGNPEPRTEPPIICPRCSATSHNRNDVANGYCVRCSWWTSDPTLSTPAGAPLLDELAGDQP